MNLLDYLLPEDESPEALRRWRIKSGATAAYGALVMTFFVLPALLGFPYSIPKLGTVAWGADVETAVTAQSKDVAAQLQAMNATVRDLVDQNRDTRAQILDKDIIESQKNWCDANDRHERATAWAQRIRDLMGQYARLTGKQYDLPTCDRV